MRKDIKLDGVTLRGWHYLPDGRQGRLPTIVMAHGFRRERNLPRPVREAFAVAGLSRIR